MLHEKYAKLSRFLPYANVGTCRRWPPVGRRSSGCPDAQAVQPLGSRVQRVGSRPNRRRKSGADDHRPPAFRRERVVKDFSTDACASSRILPRW